MGWFSWFGTGEKAVDTAADVAKTVSDGLYNGLDMVWYTDEEKAQQAHKNNELLYKFWGLVSKENTEQSKARRSMAEMTLKVYFSLILMGVAVWGFDPGYANYIFKVVGTLTYLTVPIGAIYFGPHQFAKLKNKPTE